VCHVHADLVRPAIIIIINVLFIALTCNAETWDCVIQSSSHASCHCTSVSRPCHVLAHFVFTSVHTHTHTHVFFTSLHIQAPPHTRADLLLLRRRSHSFQITRSAHECGGGGCRPQEPREGALPVSVECCLARMMMWVEGCLQCDVCRRREHRSAGGLGGSGNLLRERASGREREEATLP